MKAWFRRGQSRLPDPVAAIVITATAVFALAGIGGPLLGLSVFADTGSLRDYSGYRDVLATADVQNNYVRDLVDSAMPNSILFGEALRSGQFAAWNPYTLGGGPLGSNPNAAVASPISAPWWVLPGWLAPGYVKLLEIICGVGGMFLFLRRLRLGRAASWLGGLVFVSSAFMVAWTGWPQTRVACLIPALFWALERLAQRVRPREVALVSLPVAGMLLGGFPAVVGYTLLTAGAYLLVRVIAEHRYAWRPALARLAAAGAGVAAGVGLAAWQLVPWVQFMTTAYVQGRAQTPADHIPVDALLTAIAPYAFGTTNPAFLPDWFGSLELIDAESYLGAAALVAVVTAIALAGTARRLLPRGTWWLFVGAAAMWLAAIYLGGPLLEVLQGTSSLFSANFVGRARSVLGLLFAVLAAVGFEAVLRGRRASATTDGVGSADGIRSGRGTGARRGGAAWLADLQLGRLGWPWPRWVYGAAVWGGLALIGGWLYDAGRTKALESTDKRAPGVAGPDYLSYLHGQLAIGLGLMIVAGGAVAWLWWRPATLVPSPLRRRLAALFGTRLASRPVAPSSPHRTASRRRTLVIVSAILPILVAAQALAWVRTFYPRTDRQDFYPTNPTQEFLAAHLGHERYFGTDGAIFGSVDTTARLRSFDGHAFIDQGYAQLAQGMPGEQFHSPTTTITSDKGFAAAVAVDPVLDRAAVRFYVAPPEVTPFGQISTGLSDGTEVSLSPGATVTVGIRADSGLRGIGVLPVPAADAPTTSPFDQRASDDAETVPALSAESSANLRVTVRDGTGTVVAVGERRSSTRDGDRLEGGSPWVVPLAGESVPAGTDLTAEITELGTTTLQVSGAAGSPAITTVTAENDGLRLVYAQESVIYQRTRALDRARWASSATVVTDPAQAVQMLATATVAPNTVVLAAPGPPADGLPGAVTWVTDGLNEMILSVRAQGAGYLVLADAIRNGWQATLDAVPTDIVSADRAFAAVAVPAGTHTIRFTYPQPFTGPGITITALTILILFATLTANIWRRRLPRPLRNLRLPRTLGLHRALRTLRLPRTLTRPHPPRPRHLPRRPSTP